MSKIEQYPRLKTPTVKNDVVLSPSDSLKKKTNICSEKKKTSSVKKKHVAVSITTSSKRKQPSTLLTKRCSSSSKKTKKAKLRQQLSQTVMQRFFDGLEANSNHTQVHLPFPPEHSTRTAVPIRLGASRTRGARAYMEDRHMIVTDLHTEASPRSNQQSCCCFAAIYDGHNGHLAAQHAADRLHHVLASHSGMSTLAQERPPPVRVDQDGKAAIVQALHDSFEQIENEIIQMTLDRDQQDGATALVSMVFGGHLFVANIGDSRAVIARRSEAKAVRLTIDHKPDVPAEKERIETAGGKVIFSGCWRVAHDKVPIRLAVSRAFGDHQLKNNLPASCSAPLVSATPFVDVYELNPEDEFVILASDGVWDRISDDEAVAIVRQELSQCSTTDKDQIVKAAADKLIEVALRKRTYDNATAIVMSFDW